VLTVSAILFAEPVHRVAWAGRSRNHLVSTTGCLAG